MDSIRFDRQIRLFGAAGQAQLESLTIGVVGAGGLGSHVLQQLAYLGIRSFVMADGDAAAQSNLNRLIGASQDDVAAKRRKVTIAERLIQRISPDAIIATYGSFVSVEAAEAFRRCDFIFGCVDEDAVRFVVNEYCQAYSIPYFDVATDIIPAGPGGTLHYGGRVVYSANGEGCVMCRDVLNQESVKRGLMTEAAKEEHARLYGVDADDLDDAGPAVVSLNGVLASLAVTEFMVQATGLRNAHCHLVYHGGRGIVTLDGDTPAPDCYYCKGIRGSSVFDVTPYLDALGGARATF